MTLFGIKKRINACKEVNEGKKLFHLLTAKYGEDILLCVNQHPALGDSYLMGLYLRNYVNGRNFAVTTIGSGSAEVYQYLGYTDIEILTQEQTDSLISFARYSCLGEDKIKILHHQALKWHSGIAWQLQGAYGICFTDLIEKVVFDGAKPTYSLKTPVTDNIINQFEKYGLEKGRTVVFFPYSNTLKSPSALLWQEIIKKSTAVGKKLCTYVWNDEKPIENTVPIFCSISELVALAEYAGEIIGVRNGLMDIIAVADCKKTVYYPEGMVEGWIHSSFIDFWSINRFDCCNDAIELEFGGDSL